MLRKIDFIVVHHTETPANTNFNELIDEYRRNGVTPFHGIIDFYGRFHRLVGMNTTLKVDCRANDRCFHIAYIGKGNLDKVNYEVMRRIEVFENTIQQELEYPTLLYPINPMQQYTLRMKFSELKELFPDVMLMGINELSSKKNNPGFNVHEWLKEFTVSDIDESFIQSLFTDVHLELACPKSPVDDDNDVWEIDDQNDEEAYLQAAHADHVIDRLNETYSEDESAPEGEGLSTVRETV